MNNEDFWASVSSIIADGFTPEGLQLLDRYAEQFISGRLVYKRFSPAEQHGCSAGGATHVVASLLAAASHGADSLTAPVGSFKRERQLAKTQEDRIEEWSKKAGCWWNNVDRLFTSQFGSQIAEGGEAVVYFKDANLIKIIRLDYYIQPVLALDRISLHNAWFPETNLSVLGFGRTTDGDFVIIAEQAFIQGTKMTDDEIALFAESLGFDLINPRNWTFATPDIYLSDLHDENVIKSKEGNIFVIDCDIRINTPELRSGGTRRPSTEVTFR